MKKYGVGIVGCGAISNIYFKTLKQFNLLEVVACADLDLARANAAAAEHGIERPCTVDELLADPTVDIVVNLTVPAAHFQVCNAALRAGKHTYVEKPLSVKLQEGMELVALATKYDRRLGGAPDTFLGAGLQTSRKLIDDGWIGDPVGAAAFMLCSGHESWHPSPEFYYKPGGGPLFDMGPYYLTALVSLLGPLRSVAGSARMTHSERLITSKPHYGRRVLVETPTHIAGLLNFENGAIGTIVTSFDVQAHRMPPIEIYGTQGTLAVPDPNHFGGPVRVKRQGQAEWLEMPLTHGYSENSRGLGVADLAAALRDRHPHRASGKLALHVLEAMHGILNAAESGQYIEMKSTCERPQPMAMGVGFNGIL